MNNLKGKKVRIISMEGEPNYTGKIGIVESVDDMGQLHGTWGSLAIIPDTDTFEVLEEREKEPLELFILTEITNNDYYQFIRIFSAYRKVSLETLAEAIYQKYLEYIDAWPPFKFLDCIEDFLKEDTENMGELYTNYQLYGDIRDAIDDAVEKNGDLY